MDIYVGCAGWEYKDWVGPFYPRKLEQHNHLQFYSRYFDYTEVNSPFYNLPSKEIIYRWLEQVDDTFKYTIKVWKEITHNIHREDLDYYTDLFFNQFEPLLPKVKNFLFQFPPWFKKSKKNMEKLKRLFNLVPDNLQYVIEFRDNSWLNVESISSLFQDLKSKNVTVVTSFLEGVNSFYYPFQNTYYIRLIGDRTLLKFNRVQRTSEKEINRIIKKVNKLKRDSKIKEIFIIVNNHYSGFAPETANLIKKELNLRHREFNTQKSLIDFI